MQIVQAVLLLKTMAANNVNDGQNPIFGIQKCPDENNNPCIKCIKCIQLNVSGICINCKKYDILFPILCGACRHEHRYKLKR